MTEVLSPQPASSPTSASASANASTSTSTSASTPPPQPQPPPSQQTTSPANARKMTACTSQSQTGASEAAASMQTPSAISQPKHQSHPSTIKTEQQQSQQHQPPLASPSLQPPNSSSRPQAPARASSNRLSRVSNYSHSRSRPTSAVFPLFHSSLSYALVRDFAYPAFHPMHYGPLPSPTPSSSSSRDTSPPSYAYGYERRLSDPPPNWDGKGNWSAGPWGGDGGSYSTQPGDKLPSTSFAEDNDNGDEEVVGKMAKNHRKSKSYAFEDEYARGRRRISDRAKYQRAERDRRKAEEGQAGLDSQGFFSGEGMGDDDDDDDDDGSSRLPTASYGARMEQSPSDGLDNDGRTHDKTSNDDDDDDDGAHANAASAYHRPNSTSLDESFAGPSLALYNFEPENANELALKEGQIIQVGYRHGQGWLVAMDLETGEQGLVPEEYVRLLRDIEGWGEDEEEDAEDFSTEDLSEDRSEKSQQHRRQSRDATGSNNISTGLAVGAHATSMSSLPDRSLADDALAGREKDKGK